MEQLKAAWDPAGLLNPGKIVGAKGMLEDLRYAADAPEPKVESYLDFSSDGGFLRAVEKCNGSGDCRRLPFSDALMCPSYMASKDEWDSTRGRANVLRSVLTEQDQAGFSAAEVGAALEHCVGCKGCTKECPSGVDMAAMKLEYLYQNRGKRTLAQFAVAHVHLTKHLRWMRGLLNTVQRTALFKKAMKLSQRTSLPELESGTLLHHLLQSHAPKKVRSASEAASADSEAASVLLWADEFTALYESERLGKAVDVLEALGFKVAMVYAPSGRALLSGGFLPQAKRAAARAIRALDEAWQTLEPTAILGLEPSAVLSAKDEYLRLLDGALLERTKALGPHFMTLDRFLAQQTRTGALASRKEAFSKMNETVLVHQHCHQKALEARGETAYVLQVLLGARVQEVKSSCCGMAGSYGMQAKNAEMSEKMASLALLPAVAQFEERWILATGTSCRHQIASLSEREAAHLVDLLWHQLKS